MTSGPGTILSLARARKARARAAQKATADANALRFGRTRAERAADQARAERADRCLDAHRRDPVAAAKARSETGHTADLPNHPSGLRKT